MIYRILEIWRKVKDKYFHSVNKDYILPTYVITLQCLVPLLLPSWGTLCYLQYHAAFSVRLIRAVSDFKGRFLEFRRYHNFVNLFSKLSECTFYIEISRFL